MCAATMHADEVETDVPLVRRLLAAQFPRWADLPVEPVASAGTDNAMYRLGDDMAVRLPRIAGAVGNVEREHEWLPRLAPRFPVAVPVPLGKGRPAEGYPFSWSVCRWLQGENPAVDRLAEPGGRRGRSHRRPARGLEPAARRRARRLPHRAAGR